MGRWRFIGIFLFLQTKTQANKDCSPGLWCSGVNFWYSGVTFLLRKCPEITKSAYSKSNKPKCVYAKISFFGRFSGVCRTISIFLAVFSFSSPCINTRYQQELTSYENLLVTKILDFSDGWQCYLVDIWFKTMETTSWLSIQKSGSNPTVSWIPASNTFCGHHNTIWEFGK